MQYLPKVRANFLKPNAPWCTLDLDSTHVQVSALDHTPKAFLFDYDWAATSASSQVIPILNKSLLTVLL